MGNAPADLLNPVGSAPCFAALHPVLALHTLWMRCGTTCGSNYNGVTQDVGAERRAITGPAQANRQGFRPCRGVSSRVLEFAQVSPLCTPDDAGASGVSSADGRHLNLLTGHDLGSGKVVDL